MAFVERARLLVVDDEPTSARQVIRLLGESSFDVTAVTTGKEAIAAAVDASKDTAGFDVVLLDYYMPELGGVDVLRQLKAEELDARVILMSGREPGDVAVEAMREGAFDFISKPLNKPELRLRVERALRERRASLAGQGRPGGEGPTRAALRARGGPQGQSSRNSSSAFCA